MSKSKGALKKKSTLLVNIQKRDLFTFQRNPPRLQSTGSSVSQVSLSEKKRFLAVSLTNFAPRQ
jgi:hypothetical protein